MLKNDKKYKTRYSNSNNYEPNRRCKDALMLCAKLGVNAITTCEEAFYPQNSNPIATRNIDELAKKNGCTITGSGYQDIYWGQLISSIAGSTQK